jgi:signal transduction histidine kinase
MFERITDRSILLVLTSGFGLVILMFLASGSVSLRNARTIQASAERLVGEQGVTARLVGEVSREQGALQAILNSLSQELGPAERNEVHWRIHEAEAAMGLVVDAARGREDERLWHELGKASAEFAEEARRLVALEGEDRVSFTEVLFARHREVIELSQQLIANGSLRSAQQGEVLEARSAAVLEQSMVLLGAGLVLGLVIAILTVRMTAQMSRRLKWQAEELSRVSWHMMETQETVARRFSHELHDELGQSLTAVKANLAALQSEAPGPRVSDCLQLVDESMKNVREMSQMLRPTILDDFGLDASLRWLAERFQQRTGIAVECEAKLAGRLPDETETQLFRIAQEALTNVARHAQATEVTIALSRAGESVRLRIGDNGVGLAAGEQRRGMGLTGMRARVRGIGGELTVRASERGGVLVEALAPAVDVETEENDSHLVGG